MIRISILVYVKITLIFYIEHQNKLQGTFYDSSVSEELVQLQSRKYSLQLILL